MTADALEGICRFVNGGNDELRRAVRDLLRANNGVPIDVDDASRILDLAGLEAGFADGQLIFTAPNPLIAIVASAMADGSWARVKACRNDDCRHAFVDRSRNRSRRWCAMASCGNREKMRRARHRPSGLELTTRSTVAAACP